MRLGTTERNQLQNAALNLLDKSLAVLELKFKSIEDYGRRLRGLTRGLWNGEIDKFGFVDDVFSAMTRAFNQAWTEGARTQGVEPDERTPEEEAKLQEMINTQAAYIPGLADWIIEHSKLKPPEPFTPTPAEPPAEPVPTGDIEDLMLTEDIDYASGADTSLGGVNESYRVGIGDEEAIIKPGANIWEKEMESEAFVSQISDELGYDIVPKTVVRESGTYRLPDGSVANVDASMQHWVKDGVLGKDVDWSNLDERSYSQMTLMDSLTNNRDRHLGNWMTVDNKVRAIDNGLSFRGVMEGSFHHSSFLDGFESYLENTGKEIMRFDASDIDAITNLIDDKKFKSSFINTFDQRTWNSFEHQAKVFAKNKDALVNGIDIDFFMEDL
jgi:hypothetical protein